MWCLQADSDLIRDDWINTLQVLSYIILVVFLFGLGMSSNGYGYGCNSIKEFYYLVPKITHTWPWKIFEKGNPPPLGISDSSMVKYEYFLLFLLLQASINKAFNTAAPDSESEVSIYSTYYFIHYFITIIATWFKLVFILFRMRCLNLPRKVKVWIL